MYQLQSGTRFVQGRHGSNYTGHKLPGGGAMTDHQGSLSNYSRGCRCSECKRVKSEYMRSYRLRMPPGDFKHGLSGYTNFKCRCDVCCSARREYMSQLRYGVSLVGLLTSQSFMCAICETPLSEETTIIDHCHKTQVVRGALCSRCNIAIGKLGDDPETLRKALRYLAPRLID